MEQQQSDSAEIAATAGTLVCRVGALYCALPIEGVEETMRPLPVESLQGMPAFVLGLAVIRGTPTAVVSLRQLLSGDGSEGAERWVTLKLGTRRVALAVDAVVGLRGPEALTFDALPPLLHQSGAELVAALGTLDADLLLSLHTARLVPEPLWLAIEASAA